MGKSKKYNKNLKKIDKTDIFCILNKFNCDNIYFDDINSICQKETLSRYLMFDCNNLNNGLQAKEDICDIFYHI